MAQVVPVPLGTGSNPARYGQDGPGRMINAFPEETGPEGKSQIALYAVDGLRSFASSGLPFGVRGLFPTERRLFAAIGRQLMTVDVTGAVRRIGAIEGDGPVYFARNRRVPLQIAAAAGGRLYDIAENSIAQVDASILPGAIDVVFVDGYFLAVLPDGRVYWSGVDEMTFDAGNFFSASGNPDGLVRAMTLRREIWLFGPQSIEVWVPTGQSTQAFDRLGGGTIERGCKSGATVAKVEERIAWVADDGTVRVASGYQAERVSTHAVERAIAAEPVSALSASSYSRDGHSYYVLSGDRMTWVFDLTTKRWFERQSYNRTRWRVGPMAQFNGQAIGGDVFAGSLHSIDPTVYDESGDPLVMTIRTPIIHAWPAPMAVKSLWLDLVAGVGLNLGAVQDQQPSVGLRWSDDGGSTMSSEMRAPIGAIGETRTRVRFNQLGRSRAGRMFEISLDARVARGVMQAQMLAERLTT